MFSGFGSNFFGGASFAPVNSKFEDYFRCYPVAMMPDNVRKDDSNFGGKIFLPPSALNKLTMLHIRYPMLFELVNEAENLTSHSGVLEFVAEEGRVYLPQWTMETLNFSTLTVNDIIEIDYNDTRFGIKVLEVKPESKNKGICVIETDLETDFAPPVGYVEPEYKPKGTKSSTNPIDPSKVNRGAGAATMAHALGYAKLVHDGNSQNAYRGSGQKLSGKALTTGDTKKVSIDDLDPDAAPVEFNLPENQIFLGWPVVLPKTQEGDEVQPQAQFKGEGKSLRQSKKRGTNAKSSGHEPLKNHSRSPDYIEIDD
ncbi:hypothetical protein HF325_000913 [Metschnikowia pulcherrima]|uniref:Ubiquitin fusion degradation protein UFD1 N-terminal subdomain 1 domain-containing protein n=1 Tax=Metschnikowia pulcherrima TaxID=27326 RepID=A0A8H7LCV6_9ASCO|nr:hypothetical protein HF325_000913 [Metschnikowia pulcherrima]